MKTTRRAGLGLVAIVLGVALFGGQALANEGSPQDILKTGLLGAGVGAISAGASGGKAGKGALIGAGVGVIGNALFSFLTGASQQRQQPVYAQPYQQPVYAQSYVRPAPRRIRRVRPQVVYVQQATPAYVEQQPVYAQPAPASYQSYNYNQPQTNPNTQILRQGLLGAGVGAI